MAKQLTQWYPDTCGCVIIFEWDDAVPAEQRVHTLYKIVTKCSDHKSIADDVELFNTVMRENTMKNEIFGKLQESMPQIQPGNYSWYFDSNRVLHVKLIGLPFTQAQKLQLQQFCDTTYGINKVIVD
jgi:hypothetical protein